NQPDRTRLVSLRFSNWAKHKNQSHRQLSHKLLVLSKFPEFCWVLLLSQQRVGKAPSTPKECDHRIFSPTTRASSGRLKLTVLSTEPLARQPSLLGRTRLQQILYLP